MEEKKDENVRVMSNSERNDYDGVTIEESSGQPEEKLKKKVYTWDKFSRSSRKNGFSLHSFGWKDLLWKNNSWLVRLAIVVAIVAVASFLIFAVLPVVLCIAVIGILVWLIMQLFFS